MLTIEQVVRIGEHEIQGHARYTVNPRDVWEWLEVKTPFHKWFDRKVEEYPFVDGIDYTLDKIVLSPLGTGTGSKEYAITLDMAKMLCMVEKTVRGHEARLYFIACEKELERIRQEKVLCQAFLLPAYDHDADCLYKQELFVQICRVYGFPAPKGSQHSPGCRGVVALYINGVLPDVIQDKLYDQSINPYGVDGKTRKERHWRRLVPACHREVLVPRIDAVLHVLCTIETNARESFKRAMAVHDHHKGIVLRLSPRVSLRLPGIEQEQLWLFDAPVPALALAQEVA